MDKVYDKIKSFIDDKQILIKKAILLNLGEAKKVCENIMQSIGGQYIELNEVNENIIVEHVDKNEIDTLYIRKKDLRLANNLLWTCATIQQYICIDTDEIMEEEDMKSELMYKKLWNFISMNAKDEIEEGAWLNSYTREKFTKEEVNECIENVCVKLRPFVDETKNVLEIGCSSGLTMFCLAPKVKKYVALDMSNIVINKAKEKIEANNMQKIELYCLYAHETDQIHHNEFDICILNSVVQCFDGHIYLYKVIKNIIDKMSDNGIIFFGDIMDAQKKNDFEKSLIKYKEANNFADTKMDFSRELFLSKDFFHNLPFDFPQISNIEVSNKIYSIENELTRFRYDVLVTLDKKKSSIPNKPRTKSWYGCYIID